MLEKEEKVNKIVCEVIDNIDNSRSYGHIRYGWLSFRRRELIKWKNSSHPQTHSNVSNDDRKGQKGEF